MTCERINELEPLKGGKGLSQSIRAAAYSISCDHLKYLSNVANSIKTLDRSNHVNSSFIICRSHQVPGARCLLYLTLSTPRVKKAVIIMAGEQVEEGVHFRVSMLPPPCLSPGESFSVELKMLYAHPILPQNRCTVVCEGASICYGPPICHDAFKCEGDTYVLLDGPCEVRCSTDGVFTFDGLKFPLARCLFNCSTNVVFRLRDSTGTFVETLVVPIHTHGMRVEEPRSGTGNAELGIDGMQDVLVTNASEVRR